MADLLYVRRGEGRDVVVTTLGRRRSPGREHAQMADKLGEQNEDRLSSPSSFLQLQNLRSLLHAGSFMLHAHGLRPTLQFSFLKQRKRKI